MLTALAIEGYRSIRSLALELAPLTVVTGANGSGKSSLYRALRLLAASATDGAIPALAREGGLASTLWAGPEVPGRSGAPAQGTVRGGPVALRLGFAGSDYGYAIDFGLPPAQPPPPPPSAFRRDPEIKVEAVWTGPVLRSATLLSERRGPLVRHRRDDGWVSPDFRLAPWVGMLGTFADPAAAPELLALREGMRGWRFYDHVRTDAEAPARHPQVGTRTPVLASDGSDLAAALQTIREQGDADELDAAVDRGLPGSRAAVDVDGATGRFSLSVRQPGLLRAFDATELSDGTLRYLLWVAALLSTRPSELLVLNEPETSLHPSLLEPLAELIAAASRASQVLVVSHASELVDALERAGALRHELSKSEGQTVVEGRGLLEGPHWVWPKR